MAEDQVGSTITGNHFKEAVMPDNTHHLNQDVFKFRKPDKPLPDLPSEGSDEASTKVLNIPLIEVFKFSKNKYTSIDELSDHT